MVPTWSNEKASMDQMADAGPVLVFLTICPLAQCSAQAVLPKMACVTLSHQPALHAGTPNCSGDQKGGGVCLFVGRLDKYSHDQ